MQWATPTHASINGGGRGGGRKGLWTATVEQWASENPWPVEGGQSSPDLGVATGYPPHSPLDWSLDLATETYCLACGRQHAGGLAGSRTECADCLFRGIGQVGTGRGKEKTLGTGGTGRNGPGDPRAPTGLHSHPAVGEEPKAAKEASTAQAANEYHGAQPAGDDDPAAAVPVWGGRPIGGQNQTPAPRQTPPERVLGAISNNFDKGRSSYLLVKDPWDVSFVIEVDKGEALQFKRLNQCTFKPARNTPPIWFPQLQSHVQRGYQPEMITDPRDSISFIRCDLIGNTSKGGMLVPHCRPERDGSNHYYQPLERIKNRKHVPYGQLVEWDFTLPAKSTPGYIPVKIATIRGTKPDYWPVPVKMLLDKERLQYSGKRITPQHISRRLREDPTTNVDFEIGGTSGHSVSPFFPTFAEHQLPRHRRHGLIHAILDHSHAMFTKWHQRLSTEEKMVKDSTIVKGERCLRYMVEGGGRSTTNIFINPHNFQTIEVAEWEEHIRTFFCRSPYAKRVGKLVLLHFLDRNSTTDNFTGINPFSSTPLLTSVSVGYKAVPFVRGDADTEEWIGDRTDTLESFCFVGYTNRTERGGVEVWPFELDSDDADDMNMVSEADDSDVSYGNSILIAHDEKHGAHSMVVNVVKKHKRRTARHEQIKGQRTIVVMYPDNSLPAMLAAVADAKEPMTSAYSWSPLWACLASDLYGPHPNGILVEYNGEVEPAYIYNSLGMLNATPVGPRMVFCVLPDEHNMDTAEARLREVNAVAIKEGIQPPFRSIRKNYVSQITMLVEEVVELVKPTPGGGYVFIEGLNPMMKKRFLDNMLHRLGAPPKGGSAWVKMKKGGTTRDFLRVVVHDISMVEIFECPQGASLYKPMAADVFVLHEEEGIAPRPIEETTSFAYVLRGTKAHLSRAIMKNMVPLLSTPRLDRFRGTIRDGKTEEELAAETPAQSPLPSACSDSPGTEGRDTARRLSLGEAGTPPKPAGPRNRTKRHEQRQAGKAKVTFAPPQGGEQALGNGRRGRDEADLERGIALSLASAGGGDGQWTEVRPAGKGKSKEGKEKGNKGSRRSGRGEKTPERPVGGGAKHLIGLCIGSNRLVTVKGLQGFIREAMGPPKGDRLTEAKQAVLGKLLDHKGNNLSDTTRKWLAAQAGVSLSLVSSSSAHTSSNDTGSGTEAEPAKGRERQADRSPAQKPAQPPAKGKEGQRRSQKSKRRKRKDANAKAVRTKTRAGARKDVKEADRVELARRAEQKGKEQAPDATAERDTVSLVTDDDDEGDEKDVEEAEEGDKKTDEEAATTRPGRAYVVDEILEEKRSEGVSHFLVSWDGYEEGDNSWEPEERLHCPDKLAGFRARKEGEHTEEWKEAEPRQTQMSASKKDKEKGDKKAKKTPAKKAPAKKTPAKGGKKPAAKSPPTMAKHPITNHFTRAPVTAVTEGKEQEQGAADSTGTTRTPTAGGAKVGQGENGAVVAVDGYETPPGGAQAGKGRRRPRTDRDTADLTPRSKKQGPSRSPPKKRTKQGATTAAAKATDPQGDSTSSKERRVQDSDQQGNSARPQGQRDRRQPAGGTTREESGHGRRGRSRSPASEGSGEGRSRSDGSASDCP